jgi:lysophospholipase L1-like esterase
LTVAVLGSLVLAACSTARATADRPKLSACSPNKLMCVVAKPYDHNGRPRLQLDGDSISALIGPAVQARFDGTYDVAIQATVGTNTRLEQNGVAEQSRQPPDVEVIELGTNDANCTVAAGNPILCGTPRPFDGAAVTGRLQHFNDEFPAKTCVIFVTPDDHNPTWNPANVDVIDAYERAHFPRIVDWQKAYRPTYFDAADPHPNAVGQRALLDLIAKAVAACPSPHH